MDVVFPPDWLLVAVAVLVLVFVLLIRRYR
jgi:hypothetical protein